MNQGQSTDFRAWEYARAGDYHRNLDPNWSYTPTYLRKMAFVKAFVTSLPRSTRFIDIACGEGVLVEDFRNEGWNIEGLDLNYESEYVRQGDIRAMPYGDSSFDVGLFLDAFEHLHFADQPKALAEVRRILRPGGTLVMSVPNLAHLNSRIRMLLKGRLDRTDIEINHVGERPIWEYEELLKQAGFIIKERRGVTLTLPFIYRRVICRRPAQYRWLHDALEPIAKLLPSIAMVTIFVCKNDRGRPSRRISGKERRRITGLSPDPGIFSIFSHMTEKEGMLLFDLASGLPRNATIVETGSDLRASTCFLASGVRSCDGRVYTVDNCKNHGISKEAAGAADEYVRNTGAYRKWINSLRGLPRQIATEFKDEVDLLFINGDDSYEAVRADLEAWLPKLKPNGLVVFHDYSWAEGVKKAVRELVLPHQVEAGHRLDTIYWTRVSHKKRQLPALRASIIVPTYGRPEYLQDLLISLLQKDIPRDQYEIVVVDNKPTGEIPRILQDLNPELKKYIRYVEEANVGLHNARHAGAKAAIGEVLVYIDDDILAEPGWLSAMLEPFKDPLVAIVGGKVLPKWEAEPPGWLSEFSKAHLSLLDLGEERQELKWPSGGYGCNMAIRRSVLYEVGGFNPDAMGDRRQIWLRGDGETGLHQKVYEAGYRVMYEPRACVYHRVPADRLRPEYFYWRCFIQGISDSYTAIRESYRNTEPTGIRLSRHAIRCGLQAFRFWIGAINHGDERIRLKSQAWYWYGRGSHRSRVALSRKLRRHVLRDSYL